MADRYETDAWLVGELWKRCREMEDQIAELKKDLSVAEEFSRKQTEIINEQEKEIARLQKELETSNKIFDEIEEEITECVEGESEVSEERKVKTGNRGRHGRFTEEEVQAMADRYEGGEDATSIAKEYGCTSSTIYNLMSRRGVLKSKPQGKPVPKIDKGKVWALHDAGWDTKKICEEFVAAKATEEQIEEILAAPRPGRPGRKKKVIEE